MDRAFRCRLPHGRGSVSGGGFSSLVVAPAGAMKNSLDLPPVPVSASAPKRRLADCGASAPVRVFGSGSHAPSGLRQPQTGGPHFLGLPTSILNQSRLAL